MTRQELIEENTLLSEQIKNYRRKMSIIAHLVQQLEDSYEESKRYAMMQRYRLLKTMIKDVIYDKLIWLRPGPGVTKVTSLSAAWLQLASAVSSE